jgi:hypothetical protein
VCSSWAFEFIHENIQLIWPFRAWCLEFDLIVNASFSSSWEHPMLIFTVTLWKYKLGSLCSISLNNVGEIQQLKERSIIWDPSFLQMERIEIEKGQFPKCLFGYSSPFSSMDSWRIRRSEVRSINSYLFIYLWDVWIFQNSMDM